MKSSPSFMGLVTILAAALSVPLARAAEGTAAAPKAPAVAAKSKTKAETKTATTKVAPSGEVTLKGQLTCAKCGLKESSVCQNVLRVSDGGAKNETKYYLAKNDVAQAHHEEVCGGQVSATVTGRVTEESGKKILTASVITVN